MRRWLALVVVVAVVGIGAFAATAWIAGDDQETTTPTVTAPPPLARLRIIFPEGFTIQQMADRLAEEQPRLTAEAFVAAATSPTVNSAYRPPGITSLAGSMQAGLAADPLLDAWIVLGDRWSAIPIEDTRSPAVRLGEAKQGETLLYATQTVPPTNPQFRSVAVRTNPQMKPWYATSARVIDAEAPAVRR